MQETDSSKETGADAGAGGGQRTASSGAGSGAFGVETAESVVANEMCDGFERWFAGTLPDRFRNEASRVIARSAYFGGFQRGFDFAVAVVTDPASA